MSDLDPTIFDPADVVTMVGEPERWSETAWDSLAYRLDHITFTQMKALARGGIGEPEQ